MTFARVCAVVVAAAAVCASQVCEAKIILEPAGWTSTSDIKPDPRLDQKISYEAWHTPVKTILSDLSQLSGVTLSAGVTKQDWQIRDRKMNICVREISLGQLMDSIARVMKFKWSKNEKHDPPTYKLYADRKLLGKLQAEASRREAELRQEVTRRRSALIEKLAELSRASDEDIRKLKDVNPYLYTCADTGFAKLMTCLFSEVPGLREMFIGGGKNMIPPVELLSPPAQELCIDALRRSLKYERARRGSPDLPDDLESQVMGGTVHFDAPTPHERNIRRQLSDFGTLGFSLARPEGPHYFVVGSFRDLNSEADRLRAKAIVTAAEDGRDGVQTFRELSSEIEAAYRKSEEETEYYLMFDPVVEHVDEPELQGKITVKISDESKKSINEQGSALGGGVMERLWYQAAQKAIAEAAALNVVSDSFTVVHGDYRPDAKEDELVKVLDAFTKAYGCNWEKHGSILEFRRRDWFRRRASQIPDEWVEYWRDDLDKTRILPLDSYAEIVTLSYEQITENILSDRELGHAVGSWWEALNNEGLMRFYLQLSPAQRRMLYTKEGLNPLGLSPAQWPHYADMFHYGRRQAWGTELLRNPDNRTVVRVGIEPFEETGIRYTFVVLPEVQDSEDTEVSTVPLVMRAWHVEVPRVPRPADKGIRGSGARK